MKTHTRRRLCGAAGLWDHFSFSLALSLSFSSSVFRHFWFVSSGFSWRWSDKSHAHTYPICEMWIKIIGKRKQQKEQAYWTTTSALMSLLYLNNLNNAWIYGVRVLFFLCASACKPCVECETESVHKILLSKHKYSLQKVTNVYRCIVSGITDTKQVHTQKRNPYPMKLVCAHGSTTCNIFHRNRYFTLYFDLLTWFSFDYSLIKL